MTCNGIFIITINICFRLWTLVHVAIYEGPIMTDKVKQVIWVFDVEANKKKRINLQTLLDRANHSLRHENRKYFALEKDRDEFAKDCRS